MKSQIETLKRDIEIHKEVEKELAKRSHFCQKVIKRLKQQVKDLEAEKGDLLYKKGAGAVGGVISNAGKGLRSSITAGKIILANYGVGNNSPKKGGNIDDSKANEDLINFLEHKLEEIEKKLSST